MADDDFGQLLKQRQQPSPRRAAEPPAARPLTSPQPAAPKDDFGRLLQGHQASTPTPSVAHGAGGSTTTPAASVARPLRGVLDLPDVWSRVHRENFDNMSSEWRDAWKHETWLGDAWGTLKALSAGVDMLMSPVQAVGEVVLGQPAETVAKGVGIPAEGLSRKVGEWTSFAAQLGTGTPQVTALERGLAATRGSKFSDAVEKTLSPATRRVPEWSSWRTDPTTGRPLLNPVTRKPVGPDRWMNYPKRVSELVSRTKARVDLDNARVLAAMDPFIAIVDKLPEADKIKFQIAMEAPKGARNSQLPTGLQPLADTLRDILDTKKNQLQSIGLLQHAYNDYWPHLWKNPDEANTFLREWNEPPRGGGVRGSRGSAGLKQRTLPTIQDGLNAGLELAYTNPLDVVAIRAAGINKWYYGTLLANEMKDLPYVKFYRWNQKNRALAKGYKELNDEVFHPRLMPATVDHTFRAVAEHFEAFDPSIRQGIEGVANFIGAKVTKPLIDEYIKNTGAIGYAQRSGGKPVKTVGRFGANDAVLMHEIGHQLDWQYGVAQMFQTAPRVWKELEDLAMQRAGGQPITARHKKYLLDPYERIANLFHAYWHAPDLLRMIAPNAEKALDSFLRARPDLKAVVDKVKPSVQIAATTKPEVFEEHLEKYFPGIRQLGSYWAPEQVATVFNNAYPKTGMAGAGLAGSPWYDAIRKGGNVLNGLQLGLSGMHFSFINADAAANRLMHIDKHLWRGELGKVADDLLAAVPLAGGLYSGIKYMAKGRKFKKELLNPKNSTPAFEKMIQEAFKAAGGRISMDAGYRSFERGGFGKPAYQDIKAVIGNMKNYLTGDPARSMTGFVRAELRKTLASTSVQNPVGRLVIQGGLLGLKTFETTLEPLMAYYIPNVKLGVFYHSAAEWLKANPGATGEDLRKAMTQRWDNIDDRMGQMVYDNLFWTKTLKDLAFLGVRAVGWNLGTERALGGGAVDAAKALSHLVTGSAPVEITDRTRYSVAMTLVTALQGATLTYLFTGRGPQDLLDYFYPPDGHGGRISQPSYIRDVFSYASAPVQTVLNKLHPIAELVQEAWKNKDYYGGIIYDPDDPAGMLPQYVEWATNQMKPFSWRATEKLKAQGGDWFDQVMAGFGFIPAPKSISDPSTQEVFKERDRMKAVRTREREREQGLR